MSKSITLAMTGASGAQYGIALLRQLLASDVCVHLLISEAAQVVIKRETSFELPQTFEAQQQWLQQTFSPKDGQLRLYAKNDWFSPVASGSAASEAMVVCPASGATLSALACGASRNLIERAGDVALKERKKLILVPRETPYAQTHLENMLKLTKMGAVILPASPGFYQYPTSIEDLVNFVVARILDQLGIEQTLLPQWGDGD